jgi:hypothetical protein
VLSDNVTARELLDLLKEIKPNVGALTDTYQSAATELVTAEQAFALKEADAFLKAVEGGATQEAAKRIALIKASDERRRVAELKERKAAARLGSDAWQHFLEAVEATGHAYNRELKIFATGERYGT